MPFPNRYRASILALAFLVPQLAQAQVAGGERVLVYIDDIVTDDAKLRNEVGALTSALCGAVAKDKRLDVLCAPDVKQILGFAAASSMIGSTSPAVESVQRRLEQVKFVISGTLVMRKADVVLTVQGGPTAEGADATALFSDKPVVKVEEVTSAAKMKLLDALPVVAGRVVKGLLAPVAATPPTGPMAPPAPLK
ncbi:MAG: hypothetical protein Q8O67_20475 [Deltaproteobacteria bacterium]|nr:hypothetical protein [Deltaproteobacteria bacterium]